MPDHGKDEYWKNKSGMSVQPDKISMRVSNDDLLEAPCECRKRVIGMCVPCAVRERVKAGEPIDEVLKDYE